MSGYYICDNDIVFTKLLSKEEAEKKLEELSKIIKYLVIKSADDTLHMQKDDSCYLI
ncbi:MAG: hypothetical protein JWM44_4431 [Bacilli bacterium]|nr:hypothetical protein [Bacilli bacterium]